jgi:hypothetical protein
LRTNAYKRNIIAEMSNQPHQFKHRDVVRAFRAAEAAGVLNPRVEVRLPSGTVLVIGGAKPDATAPTLAEPRTPPTSSSRP